MINPKAGGKKKKKKRAKQPEWNNDFEDAGALDAPPKPPPQPKKRKSEFREWTQSADGDRLLDFNMTDLRVDVLKRLRKAEEIYSLEECKVFFREILRVTSLWAEEDLVNLLYLSNLRDAMFPGRPVRYRLPTTSVPLLSFDLRFDMPHSNIRYKLGRLIEEVNKSLVRLIDLSLQERRERLLLAATILAEIEAGEDA